MKLLPKQIRKEEFQYYSDKSVDDIKKDLHQLFEKTKGWNFSVNLTGEFTSDNEFNMTPKWQFVHIKGGETSVSYLHGKIFSDELKRTRITFSVKPNMIIVLFLFLFPIFGIFLLTTSNFKGDVTEGRIAGLVFTLVVPALMLAFGHHAKQGIKNRFIKTFDLKPLN